MKKIRRSPSEKHFTKVLDDVVSGKTYTVTRSARAVVEIRRSVLTRSVEDVRDSIAALRSIRDRVLPDPDGMTIRDMIESGRRF